MLARICLTVALTSGIATTCIAADPIAGDLVGLNVSLAAQKQLAVCDQLLAGEEWDAAIDLLDKLQSEVADSFVQAVPGQYLGLKVAIQQRLCNLPPAGKEVYRRRTQSVTQTLWKRARDEQDDQALWRLADEFAASQLAGEATHRLASRSALRGDSEQALRLWSRVRTVTEADQQPMAMFPVDPPQGLDVDSRWLAMRHLAGTSLSEQEREQLSARPESPWASLLTTSAEHVFAVSQPADLRWTTHATENSPIREQRRSLAVSTVHQKVVLNNGRQVRVLNALTGQPQWPSGQPIDTGEVYSDQKNEEKDARRELPCRLAGGAIQGDRYFGVIGDVPQWNARPDLVPRTTELFCLDLGVGEGRTIWRVESSNLPEPEWQFHGAPVVSTGMLPGDDLLVIPICRPQQQVELGLAAFRQDDGALTWWTRIGTATASPGQPLAETHLIVSGGLAVARTLTGVVLAIHTRGGSPQWATTQLVASPMIQRGSSAPLIDAKAGRVVMADPSTGQILALSTDSGATVWQTELSDEVLGVTTSRDHVLVSGRKLIALALENGLLQWEHGTGDPLGSGTGAVAVADTVACWPTRTGLWGLDLVSGRMRFHRQLSASPLAVPMRAIPLEEMVLIALPDELAVFDVR